MASPSPRSAADSSHSPRASTFSRATPRQNAADLAMLSSNFRRDAASSLARTASSVGGQPASSSARVSASAPALLVQRDKSNTSRIAAAVSPARARAQRARRRSRRAECWRAAAKRQATDSGRRCGHGRRACYSRTRGLRRIVDRMRLQRSGLIIHRKVVRATRRQHDGGQHGQNDQPQNPRLAHARTSCRRMRFDDSALAAP